MRIILVLLALMVLFCAVGGAELPKKGDGVSITVSVNGLYNMVYWGSVTDFSDGLLCMNASAETNPEGNFTIYKAYRNLCFGPTALKQIEYH